MRLSGRTAIVTGGGNGIGRAIAMSFAREGANVVIADINDAAASSVSAQISDSGGKAVSVMLDVADRQSVHQVVKFAADTFGGLDILVNNAGILRSTPFESISEEEWGYMIDINLKGVFLCCQAAYESLKSSKYGRIINIASNAGRDGGVSTSLAYVASKSGVIGFTRGLAKRVAEFGITCNCIAPGTTKSDILKDFTPEMLKTIESTIPLKRLGDPEDIAELSCFIASDNGSFMTGAVVDMNGGMFIG